MSRFFFALHVGSSFFYRWKTKFCLSEKIVTLRRAPVAAVAVAAVLLRAGIGILFPAENVRLALSFHPVFKRRSARGAARHPPSQSLQRTRIGKTLLKLQGLSAIDTPGPPSVGVPTAPWQRKKTKKRGSRCFPFFASEPQRRRDRAATRASDFISCPRLRPPRQLSFPSSFLSFLSGTLPRRRQRPSSFSLFPLSRSPDRPVPR